MAPDTLSIDAGDSGPPAYRGFADFRISSKFGSSFSRDQTASKRTPLAAKTITGFATIGPQIRRSARSNGAKTEQRRWRILKLAKFPFFRALLYLQRLDVPTQFCNPREKIQCGRYWIWMGGWRAY